MVWIEVEHHGYDPKDGELCLTRVKPEETLVEARRDSDVKEKKEHCVCLLERAGKST